MKSIIVRVSIVITMIVLFVCSLRLHPYYQKSQSQELGELSVLFQSNDTIGVVFIGDSWAYYHRQYDSLLCSMLNSDKRIFKVLSEGNVGAKSKEIYQRMFTTTRPLFMNRPNYCVISAGINDAVAKMGKDYYVHHYMQILHQLLQIGIKPVVLEVPDVNYRAIVEREKLYVRFFHVISSLLSGSSMYDFAEYREALQNKIKEMNMEDSIIYIRKDAWNAAGYQDNRCLYLYDETHLNSNGYHVLDSCIASEINNDIYSE